MGLKAVLKAVEEFRAWAEPEFAMPTPPERTVLFEIEEINEMVREMWANEGFLRNKRRAGTLEALELEWAQSLFMHFTLALQLGIDPDRAWDQCMRVFTARVLEAKRVKAG